MAKAKYITKTYPVAVITLSDGSEKQFPNMSQESAESICNTLGLEPQSVETRMVTYGIKEDFFLLNADVIERPARKPKSEEAE